MNCKVNITNKFYIAEYTEGKCQYRMCFENGELVSQLFNHKDEPFLAPGVTVWKNDFTFDFNKTMILSEEDMDVFISNLREIQHFIHLIKKEMDSISKWPLLLEEFKKEILKEGTPVKRTN